VAATTPVVVVVVFCLLMQLPRIGGNGGVAADTIVDLNDFPW
jgi:hypothetical protein